MKNKALFVVIYLIATFMSGLLLLSLANISLLVPLISGVFTWYGITERKLLPTILGMSGLLLPIFPYGLPAVLVGYGFKALVARAKGTKRI